MTPLYAIFMCVCALTVNFLSFSAKKHLHHINSENKNGYGGELISTFDNVIKGLWSGKERAVSASKLKVSVNLRTSRRMYMRDAWLIFRVLWKYLLC
jgi:hypothetical protein